MEIPRINFHGMRAQNKLLKRNRKSGLYTALSRLMKFPAASNGVSSIFLQISLHAAENTL
jgi:hypothetical protein